MFVASIGFIDYNFHRRVSWVRHVLLSKPSYKTSNSCLLMVEQNTMLLIGFASCNSKGLKMSHSNSFKSQEYLLYRRGVEVTRYNSGAFSIPHASWTNLVYKQDLFSSLSLLLHSIAYSNSWLRVCKNRDQRCYRHCLIKAAGNLVEWSPMVLS